ncbi:Fur-regulated basic protein FbpA [Bacillus cereus group sp. BfR-BA-01380]|uniref:Fur-regulated basic protein FbpA n=1 Tax=Bacillus cereus group sp. BfR-BA-01380 TaxID=2920324 RepID=UPI001F586257|nr:Fur-regulated basic protein FbpA [Bacillus cereus group sp. BfR-BA-01380]
MSYGLRYAVEKRKKQLIEKLIDVGIYKVLNKQLYELTLDELEKEYEDLLKYGGVQTSVYTI